MELKFIPILYQNSEMISTIKKVMKNSLLMLNKG
jgi:hypothetical protein